ncbi:MAG: hypothetical protein M3Y50_07270, partial [Acidobacteriota bacterium]|nr:hypothetical protein [Acidobacteriota bacterium]
MIYFSDSRETASRFADSIEEVRYVLRSNNIAFGTPEDFIPFSRSLARHPQLCADLSLVVKSIMSNENAISLRTILTIIAVASGGLDVASSDRDMSRPIDLLIDFLIHVGGCSQISSEHPDSPCLEMESSSEEDTVAEYEYSGVAEHSALSEHSGVAEHNDFAEHSSFNEQGSPESTDRVCNDVATDSVRPDQATVSDAESAASVAGQASSSSALQDPADRFTESLTRLELNNLQMKHYLDSIDQRIGRMEPRLEQVPGLVALQANSRPTEERDTKFSAAMGRAFPEQQESLSKEDPISTSSTIDPPQPQQSPKQAEPLKQFEPAAPFDPLAQPEPPAESEPFEPSEQPEQPEHSEKPFGRQDHGLPLWATPGQPLFS